MTGIAQSDIANTKHFPLGMSDRVQFIENLTNYEG